MGGMSPATAHSHLKAPESLLPTRNLLLPFPTHLLSASPPPQPHTVTYFCQRAVTHLQATPKACVSA